MVIANDHLAILLRLLGVLMNHNANASEGNITASETTYRHIQRRRTKSSRSLIYGIFTCLVVTTMGLFLANVHQRLQINKLTDLVIDLNIQNETNQDELVILRTLSPYQVATTEIIDNAVQNMDLYPGWITRVYPLPDDINDIHTMMDVGSFVLDETFFSLTSHQQHGISHSERALYRLNGLYPSYRSGRHQVGVQVTFTNDKVSTQSALFESANCHLRMEVKDKVIIDTKIRLDSDKNKGKTTMGELLLDKEIVPISTLFFCDKSSNLSSEDIRIAISFRSPGQYSLQSSRNSIYHIYNNEQSIALAQH